MGTLWSRSSVQRGEERTIYAAKSPPLPLLGDPRMVEEGRRMKKEPWKSRQTWKGDPLFAPNLTCNHTDQVDRDVYKNGKDLENIILT